MLTVRPVPTMQVLRTSDEVWCIVSPVASVTLAEAKQAFIAIPKTASGDYWPLWQVSYYFSAGTAKTANLRYHARDAQTGHWHALSLEGLLHEDATTATNSQVMQFEAPPGHDALALEIALTNADERPHITIRGAAWVTVAV